MNKIATVLLSVFAVMCLVAAIAGNSTKGAPVGREKQLPATELSIVATPGTEAAIEDDVSYGYATTSIFGMWDLSRADLDPYRSTDYYLHDNLVPENAEGRLPFELHTQKYVYMIDAYEPEEQELGVAWLKLENITTGEAVAFKYSPTSYARLAYNARTGEITLADIEEVMEI